MTTTTGPIRVLPIPRQRPPRLTSSDQLPLPGEDTPPRYIQDALAVDFASASDEQLFGPSPPAAATCPTGALGRAPRAGRRRGDGGLPPGAADPAVDHPEVYAVVARRGAVSARRGASTARRAVVRGVRVCAGPRTGWPGQCGRRRRDSVRALAMRLVGVDGRWRIEALQVG